MTDPSTPTPLPPPPDPSGLSADARRSRARLLAALVLVVFTGSGVLGGLALDRWMIREGYARVRGPRDGDGRGGDRGDGPRRGDRRRDGRQGGPPGMGGRFSPDSERQRFTDFLARELDLTPDQRTRVESIVGRQVTGVHALWEEMRPRMDSVVAGTRNEIEQLLTPDQRKKFAELRDRRRGPRGGGGMPGGRGPGPPP